MKNILHITPHLGGGVGRVILNYLESVNENPCNRHRVMCLDYANEKAIAFLTIHSLPFADKMSLKLPALLEEISKADLVLIHWWNHPLLYALLVRETLPLSRIIFWSLISGYYPPYVFSRPAIDYPDIFVFTTPISLETREISALSEEKKKKLRVIWSTGG